MVSETPARRVAPMQQKKQFGIGRPVRRVDDRRCVAGRGQAA